MWKGGKKDTNEDGLTAEPPHPIQDDGASRNSRRSYNTATRAHERDEPTERTRLLDRSRPPNSDGYLDPDDPAVRSPSISEKPLILTMIRYLRTTYGRCVLCAT
jgi:hypothetical protein